MLPGLLVVTVCLAVAEAYPSFQDAIPNGDLVPHPCKPNYLWKGVGHFNVLGGGDRNIFGNDFHKMGKVGFRIYHFPSFLISVTFERFINGNLKHIFSYMKI